jgi:hypothetical protein
METLLSRTLLTKVHLWLAALLFPAILMFLATGALYTWGVTGKTYDTSRDVKLSAPLDPENEAAMRALAEAELKAMGLDHPTGKARVRQSGQSFGFEWVGSRRDITIEPGTDPLVAKVTVKEASLHRTLVQLHKAKAGTAFKVYATSLATALLLLVATGLLIGLKSPGLRRSAIWGSAAGVVLFAGLVATA